MKKYKVIALSINSDKIQRVLNAGDIVDADAFHDGHAEQAVVDGFLEEHTGEQTPATTKHILSSEDLANNPALVKQGFKEGDEIGLPYESFITAEQAAELKAAADAEALAKDAKNKGKGGK